MALNINGRMKVKTLKNNFKKEFGLNIRIYNGREFADENATLASIRKGDSTGGEFSPARNTKVGNLEDNILKLFGLKTQISGSDDSYLCKNDYTLAKALEVDEKLITKRVKRSDKPVSDSSKVKVSANNSNTNNMSIEEIISKIKEVYKNHDDLDEIVTDLSDKSSITYWAEKFCEQDFPQNLELARELFLIKLVDCEDSHDFNDLASTIAETDCLNDLANEIYEKAIKKAKESEEYINIALNISDKKRTAVLLKKAENILDELGNYNMLIDGVYNSLGDKEWAIRIANNAIKNLKETDDKFEFIGYSSEVLTLGEFVASEDGMNDKELAKEIFDTNIAYEGITDLLDSARKVKELYEDSDYANKYSQKILDRAIEFVDEGYYCDIYYFIKDDLEDENRADEYKDEYEEQMREDYEQYESCEELFGEDDDEDSVDIDDIDFDDFDDVKNVIGFSTDNITARVGEEMLDSNDKYLPEFYELANENISEFLNDIKEKLGGYIENIVAISIDGDIKEYKDGMLDSSVEDFEEIFLYITLTKEIPADILNALFLDMSDYGFYTIFRNTDTDEDIIQGYDYGEYDTGYFSNDQDECYINNYKHGVNAGYSTAKEFLLSD